MAKPAAESTRRARRNSPALEEGDYRALSTNVGAGLEALKQKPTQGSRARSVVHRLIEDHYALLSELKESGRSWPEIGDVFRDQGYEVEYETLRRAFKRYEEGERKAAALSARRATPDERGARKLTRAR